MDRESTVNRKMVPRWREFRRTPARELESHVAKSRDKRLEQSLLRRFRILYKIWQESPTLENAAEVVDAAVFVKDRNLAVGPAKQLKKDDETMAAVRKVATYVLAEQNSNQIKISQHGDMQQVKRQRISALKKIINSEPRNALAWVEKCRLHAELGDVEAGSRAANYAIGCAPNNRFILRCICRFWVHVGNFERAHDTLRRSSLLKSDPWIQAAEISMSEIRGRSPQFIKRARESLNNTKLSDFHLSELAAAMGTLEASNGKRRLANKLFKRSLIDPTDNSLSQAFWVAEEEKLGLSVDASKLKMDGSAEARLYWAELQNDWQSAVEASDEWINDESFSLKAAANGSFIATGILSDHDRAVQFCDKGLIANPRNLILVNNMVVALCRAGNLERAEQLLPILRGCTMEEEARPAASATLGLFGFRKGLIDEGRRYFLNALEMSEKKKLQDTKFRVLFHWAVEEIFSKSLDREEIGKVVLSLDSFADNFVFNRMSKILWNVAKKNISEISLDGVNSNMRGNSLMRLLLR